MKRQTKMIHIAMPFAGLCLVWFALCDLEADAAKVRSEAYAIQELRDSLRRSVENERLARIALYEITNSELYLESDSRRGKSGEYIRYYRINLLGRSIGYAVETNLQMDLEHLHKFDRWQQYMDSSGIRSDFWVPTLFRESSVGLNTEHRTNRDGSIDGGWSGINSRAWGLPKSFEDEMRKFAFAYHNKGIDSMTYWQAERVWMMGWKRYLKYFGSK